MATGHSKNHTLRNRYSPPLRNSWTILQLRDESGNQCLVTCLPSAAPVTRTCPLARTTNLPVWLLTSTDSYRRRDMETYRTTYSVEHLSRWRKAAPSILCIRECELCVARDLASRCWRGQTCPCVMSSSAFYLYIILRIITKVFVHADWDLSWNKTHDDEQRLHVSVSLTLTGKGNSRLCK